MNKNANTSFDIAYSIGDTYGASPVLTEMPDALCFWAARLAGRWQSTHTNTDYHL